MTFQGNVGASGELALKMIGPTHRAPLKWRLKNSLTFGYIMGWIAIKILAPFLMRVAKVLRLPLLMGYGELSIKTWSPITQEWTDYGVVCRRVITNAGVTFLRDDWNASATVYANMNFHGIGTGTNAENVTDTALQTESTTALNPNNTRATGARTTPASNQWRSVGTLTVDADVACTEHGILDQAATGGGTLWDRSVFAAINLVGANPDSIQCTYTCTLSAGG